MPALVGLDLPLVIGFVIPSGQSSSPNTLLSRMMRLVCRSFFLRVGYENRGKKMYLLTYILWDWSGRGD